MLKQENILEVKIGENVYKFSFDPSSQAGQIFDALSQMRGFVIQKMAESNQVQQAPDEAPKE